MHKSPHDNMDYESRHIAPPRELCANWHQGGTSAPRRLCNWRNVAAIKIILKLPGRVQRAAVF